MIMTITQTRTGIYKLRLKENMKTILTLERKNFILNNEPGLI